MGECRFDKDGYCVTPIHATSGMARPAICEFAAADLERQLDEAEKLAYIGEHHFPDLTWKQRCAEEVVNARALESRLARMNEARAMAEALVMSHEGHIARLEEEKAQAELQIKGAWHAISMFRGKLDKAEACEAVIVKENEELRRRLDERAPRS